MKFIRYRTTKPEYRGILDGDKVRRINGTIFHDYSITEDVCNLSEVTLLPPILPTKIIGLRANYKQGNSPIPLFFLKPATTLTTHQCPIIYPNDASVLMAEGELAVIIGKKCRNVEERHAEQYILGYTIANDITGNSPHFAESFTQGKCYDTFTPIGPLIDTNCGWENLIIKMIVNGKICGEGNTSSMVFSVPFLISYLSSIMTLEPGDAILTGTPSPAVEVKRGDVVEIEIGSIGSLKNSIEAYGEK